MEVTFSIKYKAHWGQKLCISGSTTELGSWDEDKAIELQAEDEGLWTGRVSIDGRRKDLSYYYLVKDQSGQVLRREWKRMHRLKIREPFRTIHMDDHWINRPANSPFYSSAFYDVLFRHEEECSTIVKRSLEQEKIIFQIYAPTVPRNHRLYLTGSTPHLGEWDIHRAVQMSYLGKGEWYVSIGVNRTLLPSMDVWFKFFIADEQRTQIRWEARENRLYTLPSHLDYDAVYISGMSFDEGDYMPHFAGSVAPLFSLRGRADWGVGDFGTLRLAIDWVARSKQHVLQLLPINDTTYYRDWRDSYPYNAISVDALHPIYLDISALPPLKDAHKQAEFEQRAAELRTSSTLLYPEVMALKEQYLRLHYEDHGAMLMRKKPFRDFVLQHTEWLVPYTAFCLLRDLHLGQEHRLWGQYATYNRIAITQLLDSDEHRQSVGYYKYLQYLLSEQLLQARAYAEERGVLLKGDIPIGVAPQSVETWVHPELFHLNRSAGAPPDDFAADGQNWGFPTYNWDVMHRDNMLWWRRRFERMSAYFKSFRIDHILGFFRIWEIPRSQFSGLLGHFAPAYPLCGDFWAKQFALLGSLEALIYPCIHAEDLQATFGRKAKQLISLGLILPIERSKFYRLPYTQQSEYTNLPTESIPGGEATREQLIELCKEIALVEDMSQPGYYHPRIAFDKTRLYRRWTPEARMLWDKINHHYYYEVHNELWKRTATQRLLPLLESTDMLVCAEDLGMIPASVPEVLGELQILTLDLERMPKTPTATGLVSMQSIPYLSICTTSTHDMPPLRLWWTLLNREQREHYLASQLPYAGLWADAPVADVMGQIVRAHLSSPAMFVVLPIADWMSIDDGLHLLDPEDEQINHPENPHQKWSYRLPICLEDLMERYAYWTANIGQMLYDTQRD
ncbi:MAG: 4-alpha-glucanotransferase [Porphyromonadaceae bacterium]|nr:4-alpha-glucanotransferase [Porphyromonadaceae bacterium]